MKLMIRHDYYSRLLLIFAGLGVLQVPLAPAGLYVRQRLTLTGDELQLVVRAENERLALWRMESRLLPMISRESAWNSSSGILGPASVRASVPPFSFPNSDAGWRAEQEFVQCRFHVDSNGDIRTRCYCGNPIKPKPPEHMPPRCLVYGTFVYIEPAGTTKREGAARDVLLTGQQANVTDGGTWAIARSATHRTSAPQITAATNVRIEIGRIKRPPFRCHHDTRRHRTGPAPRRSLASATRARRAVVRATGHRHHSWAFLRPRRRGPGPLLDRPEDHRYGPPSHRIRNAAPVTEAHEDTVDDPPDCLQCGVCCFSQLEQYVRVRGDDHARLGEQAAELTHFVGNRCYLRMVEGHCAALQVEPEGRLFVCTAYAVRPQLCRDIEPGSPVCAAERHAKGDRPAALLAKLERTMPM